MNTPKGYVTTITFMLFVDFGAVGVIMATMYYFIAKRFLMKSNDTILSSTDYQLEWNYCFDVHCNSFFPSFVLLYVIQLFLLPVITRDNFISLFMGNTLYLVALCYYSYLTFIGYQILPFLKNTHALLLPIPMFFIMWALSLLGFNVPKHVVDVYFGKSA
ncbi:UNC-50 family protein [Schizosaccharomyces pombe]